MTELKPVENIDIESETELLTAWRGYVEMRRLKKKPLTDGAKKRALSTLQRLHKEGNDPTLVLNQSEDRGYTGLFAVAQNYLEERGVEDQDHLEMSLKNKLVKLADRSWALLK